MNKKSYLCAIFYTRRNNKFNLIKMNVITKTVELPDGRTISIETGKLAKQADGAVKPMELLCCV